jgi:hypothetical protein
MKVERENVMRFSDHARETHTVGEKRLYRDKL